VNFSLLFLFNKNWVEVTMTGHRYSASTMAHHLLYSSSNRIAQEPIAMSHSPLKLSGSPSGILALAAALDLQAFTLTPALAKNGAKHIGQSPCHQPNGLPSAVQQLQGPLADLANAGKADAIRILPTQKELGLVEVQPPGVSYDPHVWAPWSRDEKGNPVYAPIGTSQIERGQIVNK
jgi:hypothetical protein